MSNHIYEFLALKNDFKSKEDVFEYSDNIFKKINNIELKCYWQSKLLYYIKDKMLKTANNGQFLKKHKQYIKLFKKAKYIYKSDKRRYKLDKDYIFELKYIKNNLIELSIPYTVAIYSKIKLTHPYFSRDDEEYYYINNPILKDKATKVPMVRGSGLKGKLEVCAAEVIYESIKNSNNDLISELIKYLRIFGSGSEEIRNLNELLIKLYDVDKLNDLNKIKNDIANQFINYILVNFGGKVAKKTVDNILKFKDGKNIIEEIIKLIYENLKDKKELKVQKGRLTFYPMYFNKVKIEVINKHSKAKRVGTAPIFFEVVPEGEEANLILVYTPFDAVFSKNKEEIRKEAEEDLEFIIDTLKKLQDEGIGAKRKYGWGQFELVDNEKFIIKRNQDELKEFEGWDIIRNGEVKNE